MAGDVKTIKKRVFEIISKAEDGDRASKIFDWSIMILIALSIISIILESFANIYDKQKDALEIISKGGKIQIINAEKFFALVNGNKE